MQSSPDGLIDHWSGLLQELVVFLATCLPTRTLGNSSDHMPVCVHCYPLAHLDLYLGSLL